MMIQKILKIIILVLFIIYFTYDKTTNYESLDCISITFGGEFLEVLINVDKKDFYMSPLSIINNTYDCKKKMQYKMIKIDPLTVTCISSLLILIGVLLSSDD